MHDLFLFQKGYTDSREQARRLIEAGAVRLDGAPVKKPSLAVDEEGEHIVEIVLPAAERYVGRGGLKLERALAYFGINPAHMTAVDIGASTGGFTDCLLQQGARKVFAIDVGYGQLDWKIRSDPRVVVMERTNVRYVTPEQLGEPLDLSVVDVSFISLRIVLPTIKTLLKPGAGQVLCLIKPQFEAGREKVGKKGVVRDPETHKEVLDDFLSFTQELGFAVLGLTFSPVKGPEGNIEFLGHLTLADQPGIMPDTARLVADAHQTLKG